LEKKRRKREQRIKFSLDELGILEAWLHELLFSLFSASPR